MGLVEKRLLAHDWPQHAMAEPPAGSGLKPVMGDAGLPIVGHMIEMFRGGPDFCACSCTARAAQCSLLDSPVLPSVIALGPDATQVHLLQPQQGLLTAGLGSGHRAVLQSRPDAARLRRAHVPPPDHAGGVRPHPAGRLHRARRHGGLAGDRQRLGGQRRPVPVLSGDEGAHPRHRLDGVHGPRARHRPRTGDQGQQGLHHDHARRQRDHPHQRAARSRGGAASRPASCWRTTSRSASRSAAARTAPTC